MVSLGIKRGKERKKQKKKGKREDCSSVKYKKKIITIINFKYGTQSHPGGICTSSHIPKPSQVLFIKYYAVLDIQKCAPNGVALLGQQSL
jgi:hypothetical protein